MNLHIEVHFRDKKCKIRGFNAYAPWHYCQLTVLCTTTQATARRPPGPAQLWSWRPTWPGFRAGGRSCQPGPGSGAASRGGLPVSKALPGLPVREHHLKPWQTRIHIWIHETYEFIYEKNHMNSWFIYSYMNSCNIWIHLWKNHMDS